MKKLFCLITIFLFIINHILGQETTYSLTIKIINLRSDKGLVGIIFFDENEVKIKGEYRPIKNNVATITYDKLKKGKYGIRVYHDENKNDKMDFNWFRMPKEGFGFSGSTNGSVGFPDIHDMLFSLNNDKQITIKMMYIL